MTLTLSLEHIHEELADIECEVELEYYQGSCGRVGHFYWSTESDDPSGVEILSVKSLVDYKTNDGKMEIKKGQKLNQNDDLEEQILELI